jgi:hypothetical protein
MEETLSQLLIKHRPILYLHTEENYFPSTIDFILQNSFLQKKDKTKLLNKPLTSSILYDSYKDQAGKDTEIVLDPSSLKIGQKDSLNSVPIYGLVKTIDNKTHLFYNFIYPYNGEKNVASLRNVGAHYGDIEHITVVLNQDNTVSELFYAAHGSEEGRWLKPNEVTFEGDRPIVYVAKYSHASYPKEGVVFRFFGFGNDYTNKGTKWDPNVIRLYEDTDTTNFNKDTMGWMYYGGDIGYDGVDSLGNREYIKQGDSRNNKPFPIISYARFRFKQILFFTIIIGLLLMYSILAFSQKLVNPYLFLSLFIVILYFVVRYAGYKLEKI